MSPTIKIVSTVLRPVGPHEPRVYWLRRAVVIGLILVLIVVLTEAFAGGSSKPPKKNRPVTHPSTTTTATSSASTPATTTVSACSPTALTLALSTDSDSYKAGQSVKLIGAFSNSGTSSCTLSVAPSREIWTVKSGTDTIWTSKHCVSSDLAKQVTIKAGGRNTVSTVWDGHRQDPGCASGAVALRGEYTLSATLDGMAAKTAAIFHVTSP